MTYKKEDFKIGATVKFISPGEPDDGDIGTIDSVEEAYGEIIVWAVWQKTGQKQRVRYNGSNLQIMGDLESALRRYCDAKGSCVIYNSNFDETIRAVRAFVEQEDEEVQAARKLLEQRGYTVEKK